MTFFEEAVISGFIGEVISKCTNITKEKIKEADEKRNSKNQYFEIRVYQIIIDAINEVTHKKYENLDVLYDTAENLLNGFKSYNNRFAAVRSGLSILIPNVNNVKCKNFMDTLYAKISKEDNFDIYKEILLILKNEESKYAFLEIRQIKKELRKIDKKINCLRIMAI